MISYIFWLIVVVFFSHKVLPNNVRLHKVLPGELLFSWDPVNNHCESATYYLINASNCGNCPTTSINQTFVTCDIHLIGDLCEFTVQTLICNFPGIRGASVYASLKGIILLIFITVIIIL